MHRPNPTQLSYPLASASIEHHRRSEVIKYAFCRVSILFETHGGLHKYCLVINKLIVVRMETCQDGSRPSGYSRRPSLAYTTATLPPVPPGPP
jgi:hypothetical protein